MLKKSLIVLFIITCILCISNACFANNTMNDMKNGVMSATNAVVDGVENLAEDAREGVGDAQNSIEGALTMNTNMTGTNTNGYTSARTSATITDTTTRTSTLWIWAIVAIAAIGIIGLVWFYSTENRVH